MKHTAVILGSEENYISLLDDLKSRGYCWQGGDSIDIDYKISISKKTYIVFYEDKMRIAWGTYDDGNGGSNNRYISFDDYISEYRAPKIDLTRVLIQAVRQLQGKV